MNNETETARLLGYLKSLNSDELDQVLNEVLHEIRSRESEQMKKDVLTHSQKLARIKIERPE
jgi:cobalamin biosynthesis Co2+ chelatase CbiK